MKIKIRYSIPLITTAALAALGYFAGQCGIEDSCSLSKYFGANLFSVIQPLYLFSLFSIPAVLFLPFVSKKVFSIWMKFAIVWLLLSLYVIASSPVAMNAWFFVFDYTRGNIARLFGIAFSVISIMIVLVAALATRKKR